MSRLAGATLLLAAWLAGAAPASGGHEFPFYPSFYPQEIRIETVAPRAAVGRLQDGSLHAYVGADPFAGTGVPPNVSPVESLGAYVVVTLNPAAPFFADRAERCLAARAVVESLAARPGRFTAHPYPVTPYHGDFLQHADLAGAALGERLARGPGRRVTPRPRIKARGPVAESLVPSRVSSDSAGWDAIVETLDVAELAASRAIALNGWLGPPWIKEGWFHAYLLHADAVADGAVKQRVETIFRRLVAGQHDSLPERLELERQLVSLLRGGCERGVAGYTLRREYLYTEYSGGAENVAHDAQSGLVSPIFPRTAKLKDFPWNGWLTVGSATRFGAAWNPVGGFTDRAGRLVWAAVGDPGLFPSPRSGSWVPNRVTATVTSPGGRGVEIPVDAVVPEPGTGLLRTVGPGQRASAQILYRVLASAFHDGTRMTVGDFLYAVSFAYRWDAKRARDPKRSDPGVDAATALLRERLAGLRVLRVDTDTLAFGEDKLTYEVPIVEVYVNHAASDPRQVAAVAAPWSSVPWHVLVLMEEAVTRGLAAFSQEQAQRRGVPWLDVVRNQKLKTALASLVNDLGQQGYVPDSLKGSVSPQEARARWAALRKFYDANRHFLVTNGPYVVHQWAESSVTLRVFRDLTYPVGLGAFNAYAVPLRAHVTKADLAGSRLDLQAEVEKVERFGRELRVVTEPFVKRVSEQDRRSLPVGHYVVVEPDGTIVAAGTAPAADPGTFRIELPETGKPGTHTILVGLSLDGNLVNLPVKVIPWTR